MKKLDFTKLVIMLLVLSMMLTLFAACTEGGNDPTDTVEGTDETTAEIETFLDIVKDGKLVPVVYGALAEASEISVAKSIIDRLNSIVGVSGRPVPESVYNPDEVEILVGYTTYPETQELLDEIGYGESAIKVIGKKLVVVGQDNEALKLAVNHLVNHFNSIKDKDKNISISTKYFESLSSNKLVAMMPVHPDFNPTVMDTGRDCYMMHFGGDTEEFFREYIQLMEDNGFELYAKNVIEENEYYTYTKDTLVVTALFTKYNRVSKFLVEELETTGLAPRAEDNAYTPIEGMDTLITQIGLFYNVVIDEKGAMTNNFNGMSYVIRLDDGSFIIVDGGHNDKTHSEHMYETLKMQAPDPENIVIAAWFFSHEHGDHTGMFKDFITTYKEKLTIERFVLNFPTKEMGGSGEASTMMSYMSGFFKDADIIKAHPGQEFHIRNATITMLYTADVYESGQFTDSNNASIVWKMDVNGKSFLCLGDYSESSKTLRQLYTKETLKSDIVQIAHHGISGQDGTIYPIIEPEYAFWPVGAYHVIFYSNGNMPDLELDKKEFNKYFMQVMDQDKVFLAEDNFIVMSIAADGTISTTTYDNDVDFYANYKN